MKSTISIFDYTDYRTFLEAEYRWQRQNNPRFSLRFFAMRANVRSYTTLKYVIERKRHLSFSLVDRFADALELDENESEYFHLLWGRDTAASGPRKSALQGRIEIIRAGRGPRYEEIHETLRRARLLYEKCQLEDARTEFTRALRLALGIGEAQSSFEALAGLIRCLDDLGHKADLREAESLLESTRKRLAIQPPPTFYWYSRGALAACRGEALIAQGDFLRFLRSSRTHPTRFSPAQTFTPETAEACAWTFLIKLQCDRKKWRRAEILCRTLLKKYEASPHRGVMGHLFFYLGYAMENRRDLTSSQIYYEKAHASFRQEQNWYCCLYALFSYARIARLKGDHSRSIAYLDIVRISVPREFRSLHSALERECARLRELPGPGLDSAGATSRPGNPTPVHDEPEAKGSSSPV